MPIVPIYHLGTMQLFFFHISNLKPPKPYVYTSPLDTLIQYDGIIGSTYNTDTFNSQDLRRRVAASKMRGSFHCFAEAKTEMKAVLPT